MKKKVLQTILLIGVCLVACNSNEKAEQQEEKELEYVYIDAINILHIDKDCENICINYGTRPVDAYPVSQIYYVYYRHICATCVDEKYYDQLHINTTSNLIKYYKYAQKTYSDYNELNLHSRSYEDFVKYVEYSPVSFYNDLIEDGYTMPPYHEFFKEIAHPNLTATDNQRKVYNALREKHSDIPENFNKFQSAISDTNTLRTYYNRMKQDGVAFLPNFESFVVDLGLDPNQPAEKKLLL